MTFKTEDKEVMEIGSEFWINGVLNDCDNKTPIWLSKFGNSVFTSSGRGAINLLLQQINPICKTVLLPAYICESVVKPFIKNGYSCLYYNIYEDLASEISNLLLFKDVGIFVHMGYFGFNTNSNLEAVLKYFKNYSTVIIEDVTHTLFSNYKRYIENDFYIGSIRKWFGIPSGGFLASKKFILNRPLHSDDQFHQIREEALRLKGLFIKNNEEILKKRYLELFCAAEKYLDTDMTPYNIDHLSRQILNTIDSEMIIGKRRYNYSYLLEGIEEKCNLKIIFPFMDIDICPLFFPILVKGNRELIKRKLIDERIFCPTHWLIPSHIPIESFSETNEIYEYELSIPCDQRYDIGDMKRLVSVINRLMSEC